MHTHVPFNVGELEIFCCSSFYDAYILWINENRNFMKFNLLNE